MCVIDKVSYLEIYNESGFDLLDPSHETKALEDLPKVRNFLIIPCRHSGLRSLWTRGLVPAFEHSVTRVETCFIHEVQFCWQWLIACPSHQGVTQGSAF